MRKILGALGIVTITMVMMFIPVSCSANNVVGKAGISERTEGHWQKINTKKTQISQNIPKKYRGTRYTWNVLANRKERIKVKARSFQYAYLNKKGKYVILDQYEGKKLAVWKTKYNNWTVNYVLKTKKDGQYKLFDENFKLKSRKGGIKLSLPNSWMEMVNHNSSVVFKKKLTKPAMKKLKITKSFLSKETFITQYFKKNDVYYMVSFNKKMTHMLFNSQPIWSNSGPSIGSDVADLSAGGDSSGYGAIKKVSFKGNKATVIVSAPASMVKTYYKIQFERISKKYLVVNKISKAQENFNGNKVHRTPSLFNIRFVATRIYKN